MAIHSQLLQAKAMGYPVDTVDGTVAQQKADNTFPPRPPPGLLEHRRYDLLQSLHSHG